MECESVPSFEVIVFVFTPKEFRHIAQGCSRSEFGVQTVHVPRRGSVIRFPPMTQPFQGRPDHGFFTQGSPHSRATLGYVTQSLRDKDGLKLSHSVTLSDSVTLTLANFD